MLLFERLFKLEEIHLGSVVCLDTLFSSMVGKGIEQDFDLKGVVPLGGCISISLQVFGRPNKESFEGNGSGLRSLRILSVSAIGGKTPGLDRTHPVTTVSQKVKEN